MTGPETLHALPAPPVGDDPADLAGMFARYGRRLLVYCACRVEPDAAEDVVAETFLVAYARRHRYDHDRPSALPWLYGIATNLVRRHRRTEARAYRAYARAARQRLAAALTRLPRRQRDVLLLYAVAQLEYAEIAEALDIPLGSVRSSLHRARAKLRAGLGAPTDEAGG